MGALTVAVSETIKIEISIFAEIIKKFPIGMLANTIGDDIAQRYSFGSHKSQIQSAIFEGLQKLQKNEKDFFVNVFDNYTLKVTPTGDGCVLSLIENTVTIK